MAIYRIAGQMLQSTLERDGNNLAFSDTVSTTSTLFIDIANSRVGINSNVANVALDVNGNIAANNLAVTGIVSAAGNVYAGNISISNTTITPTGNLVIFPGNEGVVIPAGNTEQRPSPAQTGTIRINTALQQVEAWDGNSWVSGGGGGGGNVTIVDQQITPDGSNVTYTLDQSSTDSGILVSINGVGQLPGSSYSVTGNSITFAQIPETTDIIDIRFLAYATNQNQILNSSGNTKIQTNDSTNITFTVGGTSAGTITIDKLLDISPGNGLKLPAYTVAQAANLANVSTGQVIYCSDGDTGNPCLAVYSGGAFRRVSFGANNTTEQLSAFLAVLKDEVSRLRQLTAIAV